MPNWKKVIVSGSDATLNSLFVANAVTASIFSGSHIGPLTGTASWATNAINASTASSADNFLVRGTLTAQTIVAQVITSSTDFVTGSTRFGSLSTNTHQFTGSVSITGSLAMYDGNVGIGTTSPLTRLDIRASTNSSITPLATVPDTTTTLLIGNTGTNGVLALGHDNAGHPWLQGRSALANQPAEDILINPLGGNVGIGTTSPGARLEVSSSVTEAFKITGGTVNGLYSTFFNGTITPLFLGFGGTLSATATNNDGVIRYNGSYNLIFTSDGTERMRLNSSGNVGINCTGANAKLEVVATTGEVFRADAASGAYRIVANQTGVIMNGNVGIGTTSPAYKLQVSGGDIAIDFNRYLRGGSGGDWNLINLYNGGTGDMEITMLNTGWYLRHNANATFAGNVGIGTTSPSVRLDISGSTVITGSLTVITGSNIEFQVLNTGVRIGNIINDIHTVTGSLGISGSVTATNFTGSLFGTASWANNVVSSSYALNAGNAQTASFAITASFALNGGGGPSGPSSGAAYTHTQASPSTTWTVDHSLNNSYPVVTVYDFNGFVVVPLNISSSNVNRTTITFSYGATGYATAVAAGVSNIISASFATNAATAQTASFFGGSISSAVSASYASSSTSASFVTNAVTAQTASFFSGTVTSASYALNAGNTQTASFATNAGSASYALNAGNTQTASFATNAGSASYALNAGNAQSSSFAATASSADNFLVRGTLTAQTIVAQVITSSTDFVTGSTRFGTIASNTHQFTGSVSISGSLTVQGSISGSNITGSLLGTASYANNALSSSYALNAGNTISASFSTNAGSSSYALNAGNTISASFATNANSASYALNAGNAQSASFATNAVNAFIQNGNSFGAQALLGTNDAQNLAFETSGSIRMTINGSNGNVGIGSISPLSLLNVNAASNTNLTLTYTANTGANFTQLSGGSVNLVNKWATIQFKQDASENAHHIIFSTANGSEDTTERVRITSSGSVGIGTTTPAQALHITTATTYQGILINGNQAPSVGFNISTNTTPRFKIGISGTNADAFSISSGSAGTDLIFITGSGEVGIGTTTPSAKLDVNGNTVITGSLTVITGSNIEFQVLNTGVRIGNLITDVHTVTGSLGISGSVTATNFTGSLLGTASFATSASWAPGGGGGGTPGGSNTQIQYNNASTFGGVPVLTFDGTTLRATGSFTGSLTGALIGTASFATSASWAPSAGGSTFPFTGTAVITGSLVVTGSFDLNNTRFNSTSSATTAGTTIVSSNATASFNSAFYNYYISSGSNARAGQIMSVWSGSTINYTEVTTTDIGNTNTASLAVTLATGNVRLSFTAPGVWTVRSIVNLL